MDTPKVGEVGEVGGRRVQCDFEVDFLDGGALQAREFRLEVGGAAVDDDALASLLVRRLQLRRVRAVRIRSAAVIGEGHAGSMMGPASLEGGSTLIDLSHTVEDGMTTYPGLPGPVVSAFLRRDESRSVYAPGTEFHIGRVDICGNTGTYVDSPFHRYADGEDLSALPLERLADIEAVVVDAAGSRVRAVGRAELLPYDVYNKAVLIHTGWDRHWRTAAYFVGAPYLTGDGAQYLADAGALLVGIDSLNIDDTADGSRPAHSTLLAAGIPICEHLTRLSTLPSGGFRFSAVPVKLRGMGTFPVRAYAALPAPEGSHR